MSAKNRRDDDQGEPEPAHETGPRELVDRAAMQAGISLAPAWVEILAHVVAAVLEEVRERRAKP